MDWSEISIGLVEDMNLSPIGKAFQHGPCIKECSSRDESSNSELASRANVWTRLAAFNDPEDVTHKSNGCTNQAQRLVQY